MVGDNHRGLLEGLAARVAEAVFHSREVSHGQSREVPDHLVETQPLPLAVAPHKAVGEGIGGDDDEGENHEDEHYPCRARQTAKGQGHIPSLPAFLRQPPENEGRQIACHDKHRRHSDDGHFPKGAHGGMLGEDQHPDAHEHQRGRDDDASAVALESLLPVGVFVH